MSAARGFSSAAALQWDASAGRYFLGPNPVHAGDGVECWSEPLGAWVGGRVESDDSGRILSFYPASDDGALGFHRAMGAPVLVAALATYGRPILGAALRWPERGL